MNRSLIIIFFFGIFLLTISCDRNRIFEKNRNFNDRIWDKNDVATFQFQIDDIHFTYDFYCNLRNSILYSYQNIYLSYSLEDTLGNVLDTNLANFELFNSKTGEPFGDGMGDIFDHRFPIVENYSFNIPGVYVFKIKHYMRPDTLPEIMSVGLRIERREINN